MKINKTIKLSLVSVLLVFGCLPQKQLFNSSTPVATTTKKVVPYTGPVELKIDTSIAERIGVRTEKKEVILDSEEEKAFSINSVPSGNIVFQETFKIEHKERLFTRNFTINDTSKRYTIHLQRKSPCNAVARVNINGMNWIVPSDFKRRTQLEVSKSSLLLNNSNYLQIRLKGNPRDEITVSIVEGGETGTLKRRLGKLSSAKTNEERLLANDTNIFYPNNEDSLGDLKPFDGEKEIGEGNNSYRIGITDVNNGISKFRIGEVSATLREPVEENLQILLSRYNAQLLNRRESNGNQIVVIKLDLNSTNMEKIISNIKALNLYSEMPLTKLTFSSINTAKTVANFVDILVNSSDLVSNTGLNLEFEQTGTVTQESRDERVIDKLFKNKDYNTEIVKSCTGKEIRNLKNPKTSDDMWWLTDPKITEAWDYSFGQNSSIAIIDAGFGGITNNPEFKEKIKYPNCDSDPKPSQCQVFVCSHGNAVSSILASDIDDNLGIAGVSPRSNLYIYDSSGLKIPENDYILGIPNKVNSIRSELVTNKVDVLNISSGIFLSDFDFQKPKDEPKCYIGFIGNQGTNFELCNTQIKEMAQSIDFLAENKVVVVSTVGNDGKFVGYNSPKTMFFPGCLRNVLSVGAYEMSGIDSGNPFSGDRIRADFCETQINNTGNNNFGPSSSYGEQIDIWAPGDNISVFERQNIELQTGQNLSICEKSGDVWNSWAGTSHAAPIVSGVVSLLKSIDKNLDVNDIRRILQETGDTLNHPSFLSSNGQKSLNALRAVQSLTSKKFDTFTGVLLTEKNLSINQGNLSLILEPNYSSRYKEFMGKKVIVEAWKNDSIGTYSVRRMKLQSDDFIASNPKGIINTNPQGTPLDAKPNNTIAVPIPSTTRDLSKFSIALGGGQNITLKEIVDDYLIAKVPPTLPQGIQDIIIKETGRTDVTYHNALRILAGLDVLPAPTTSVSFPNSTTIPPSDDELETNIYLTELNSQGKHISKKLREIITNWANDGVVFDVTPESKEIIKALAKPLKLTPGYDTTNPNYEVSLDLIALSLGYQPINCPALTNYVCTGDRWAKFNLPAKSFIDSNTATAPVEVQPNQSIGIALDGDLKGLQITSQGQGFEVQSIAKDFVSASIPATLSAGVHDITVKTDLGEVIFREAINIRTNNQIAFDSNRDGNQEIYVMDEDGSNQRRLTFTSNRYDYGATWSPNKEKIAFDSEHNSGEEDIFVVNPDGTGMMNLTNSPDDEWDPFWSYDSTKITYTSDDYTGDDDIWEINADGTNRRQLTNDPEDEYNSSYSPDGSKIVYVSEATGTPQIFIMNSDGSGQTRLTNSSYGNGRPKWSMTGKKISWESYTANNDSHIWQMNPDGSEKEQLTFNDDYRPWYSPDGTKIAYHTYINNDRRDIKVLDLRTRVETNLTAVNPSKTLFDGWLNDSSKVLYSSKMDGDYEIYSQRYDGSDLRQLTFNTADDFNAAAHSHREVFTTLSMSQVEKVKLAKRRAKYDIPERHYWKLKK